MAEILFLRTKGFSKKEIARELKIPFQSLSFSQKRYKRLIGVKFVDGIKGYVK